MSYSCSVVADNVLDFILNELSKNVGNGSSNGWFNNGTELFFQRGCENLDGAITGQIYRVIDTKRVGNVRIEPNGTITRFSNIPASLRKLAKKIY